MICRVIKRSYSSRASAIGLFGGGGMGRVMYITILQYRYFFIARRYWRQRCWKTRLTTGRVLPGSLDDEDIGYIINGNKSPCAYTTHVYCACVYELLLIKSTISRTRTSPESLLGLVSRRVPCAPIHSSSKPDGGRYTHCTV